MKYREAAMYKTVGKIDLSLYELPSHTDTLIGTQLRFNHSDCEAGVDTKERLYVKAVDTGWIAYCHHCSKSGFLRTSPYRVGPVGDLHYPTEETRVFKDAPSKYKGDCLICDPLQFPVDQLLWLYSYGFDDKDIVYYNVKVSKVDGSIVIPKTYHLNDAYYVRRKFTDHFDRGPKALMYRDRTQSFVWRHVSAKYLSQDKFIICEDPISAMKLNKAGANSISLMGTNLTHDVKEFLLDINNVSVLLFLDPDTAGMKAALKIKRELQSIVDTVTIHNDPFLGRQPKETDMTILTDIVKEFYAT